MAVLALAWSGALLPCPTCNACVRQNTAHAGSGRLKRLGHVVASVNLGLKKYASGFEERLGGVSQRVCVGGLLACIGCGMRCKVVAKIGALLISHKIGDGL